MVMDEYLLNRIHCWFIYLFIYVYSVCTYNEMKILLVTEMILGNFYKMRSILSRSSC